MLFRATTVKDAVYFISILKELVKLTHSVTLSKMIH